MKKAPFRTQQVTFIGQIPDHFRSISFQIPKNGQRAKLATPKPYKKLVCRP
jgi:hypothetical protein